MEKGTASAGIMPLSSSLSGAVQAGALSVLEECSDALAVYQHTLKKRREQPTGAHNIDYWRMPSPQPEASASFYKTPENWAAFELGTQEVIFEKLRQDSEWLEDLVHSTKRSLATKGNFDPLIIEVAGKVAVRTTEEDLLQRARDSRERLECKRREVFRERTERTAEEEHLKTELLRLRNEKEKLEVKSRAELAYVEAWLDSRRQQQRLRADVSREQLVNELRRCRLREDNERLVTSRVEAFLHESIELNERAAINWSERRRAETRTYEREIRRLRGDIEARRAALKELREEYDQKQEFIDSCLAEKEAARRLHELEAHVRGCAIRIQAWWRGVMVRCKLGPYRPEEKKRKRPAKSKK